MLACPESGSHVIALTSGHFGGTNRLARRIARITGGQAVIGSPRTSTASPPLTKPPLRSTHTSSTRKPSAPSMPPCSTEAP
ncbi:MAG: hypothetical protein ACLSTO_02645 [Bilophila wadsworthia]